jgi:hypothetical protein
MLNNQPCELIATADLSNIAGGYVSDLRNTRHGLNTGAFLGGMYAQHKTAQALEPYVGPGLATTAGMAAGLGGSLVGGVGLGAVGFGADVYESVTGRKVGR